MRIDEFAVPTDDSMPYDVVDDVKSFILNDKDFYRRTYYPSMCKLQDEMKKGNMSPKTLFPVVDQACEKYCNKFNIDKQPKNLLDKSEKVELIQRLIADERENLEKGDF
jgi:hypothetical protein